MREEYDSAMTRRGNVVAIAVGVAVLVSACSSDDAAPNTTVAEVEVDTISPPTSTEAPATPTTSTTSSTDAPTTTLDPAATLAADVEADLLEAFSALYAAIQDPMNDEKVEAALAWHIESNRDFIAEQLDEYRANGWVARPNPDVQAATIIEVPPTLIEPSDDLSQVQVCEVDSWIVVEPGAGPDGTGAIVNAEVNTYRSNFFLRLTDDRWKVEGSAQLGSWEGVEVCPAI